MSLALHTTDNGDLSTTYGKTIAIQNWIGGKEQPARSGETFNSTNPSDTRDIVAVVPSSAAADMNEAITAAEGMRREWRNTPAPVRANIIGTFGELMAEIKDDIAYLATREMGKTLREAGGSVQEAIDTAQFFQSEGRRRCAIKSFSPTDVRKALWE